MLADTCTNLLLGKELTINCVQNTHHGFAGLPVAVVLELVVAGHGQQASKPDPKRVEDLGSGVTPHLNTKQAWVNGSSTVNDSDHFRIPTQTRFKRTLILTGKLHSAHSHGSPFFKFIFFS